MRKTFTLLFSAATLSLHAQPWNPLGTGMNNLVRALYSDASSGRLYAAGSFTTAGGTLTYYITYWNGSSWSAMGSPANKFGMNTAVNAITSYGGSLYIGGEFTNNMDGSVMCARIARWNGSGWVAVGSPTNGVNNFIYAMAEYNGELYVAGTFTTAGGSAANRVARWNGSAWSAAGSGIGNGTVYTLAVYNGELYAGGNFTFAGSNHIVKWDGSNWVGVGGGMGAYVRVLKEHNGLLYAGGNFTTAGGSGANRIASWDGSVWSALGSGVDNAVFGLTSYGAGLYAGGFFNNAGGSAANRVALWDGSAWTTLGDGLSHSGSPSVYAMETHNNEIYAGGFFTFSGVNATNYTARWTPAPLPVEIISFTASAGEDRVVLNWTTASETNSDYFVVERKTGEGEEFVKSGVIKAAGNTSILQHYSFIDLLSTQYPIPGTIYYRLRRADLDGTGRYLETISVTLPARTPSLSLTLSGNSLRVSFNPAAADASIHVFDMTGNEVMGRELHGLRIGDHSSLLDASGLNTGIYFLCLRSGGSEMTRRFVIR